MYDSWDMVRDGQMDGQKKWRMEVDAPPKKMIISLFLAIVSSFFNLMDFLQKNFRFSTKWHFFLFHFIVSTPHSDGT